MPSRPGSMDRIRRIHTYINEWLQISVFQCFKKYKRRQEYYQGIKDTEYT